MKEILSQPRYWGGVRREDQTIHPRGISLLAENLSDNREGSVIALSYGHLNGSNEATGLEFRVNGKCVSYDLENDLANQTFAYRILMESGDFMLVECEVGPKNGKPREKRLLLLKRMDFIEYNISPHDGPKDWKFKILAIKAKFSKDPSAELVKKIMAERADDMEKQRTKDEKPFDLHPYGIQLFYGNIADGSYVHMIANETVNSSKEAAALKTFDRDGWTGYESEDGVFKHRVIREIGGSFYIVECADLPYRASGSFGEYMLIKRAKWRFYEDETPKDLDVLICLGSSHDAPADETIDAIVKSCGLSPQGKAQADGGK